MNTLSGTLTSTAAVQFSTGDERFSTATIFAYRGFTAGVPTHNTGTIYAGFSSTELPITITSGANFNWELAPEKYDSFEFFNKMWFQGSSGDGFYAIYY